MKQKRGRPKTELALTDGERTALERMARRARSSRRLAFRGKIVLRCAQKLTNVEVARQLRTSRETVGKWRKRFLTRRLAGLYDDPRPGAPRSIDDDKVEDVVIKTLETTPRGRTHWSTRGMARNVGLSHSTIGRIWRAFGLQPHRTESFPSYKDEFRGRSPLEPMILVGEGHHGPLDLDPAL